MTWLWVTMLIVCGALVGWLTNWCAIQLLFRPLKPRYFFGVRFQGLISRRHVAVAEAVAQMVEEELLSQHTIRTELHKLDLEPYLEAFSQRLVKRVLSEKISRIPLFGGLIHEQAQSTLEGIASELLKQESGPLKEKVAIELEARLQVKKLVEDRILALDLIRLEGLVWRVARLEFRAIIWMGAVLGGMIGLIQALLLLFLGKL